MKHIVDKKIFRYFYKKDSIDSALKISSKLFYVSNKERVYNYLLSKFNLIWNEASNNVAYYAKIKSDYKLPEIFSHFAETEKIPKLTKDIIKTRPHLFQRRLPLANEKTVTLKTGGSTGEPLIFRAYRRELAELDGAHLAQRALFDVSPSDRIFLLWGHGHLYGSGWARPFNVFMRRMADFLFGWHRASAYDLSPDALAQVGQQMLNFKPAVVISYTTALREFVSVNQKIQGLIANSGIKLVVCCADPMTPGDWDLFRDFFGCPVVSEYGSVETIMMAFAEEPGRYYVNWPQFLLQTEKPEIEGAVNLLVTKLVHSYLPLIRYEVDDFIVPDVRLEDEPSSPVMVIQSIVGRKLDILTLADGSRLHGSTIHDCVRHLPKVRRFQIVERNGEINVRLLCTVPLTAEEKNFVRQNLARIHPLLKHINIVEVDDIPVTVSGKHRFVIHEE